VDTAAGRGGDRGRGRGRAPLDHVPANVADWNGRTEAQLATARTGWSAAEPVWGIFGIPERDAGVLPVGLAGADVAELGCGTAYVSAWLARRGARPVAVDPADGQLAIARRFQDEFGLRFPLVRAAGEEVPLRGGAFDVVISEYGAAIWADPHRWIPEAARLLRPGGELVFLGNSTLVMLCVPDEGTDPADDRLRRDLFGMHRFTWPDDQTVEFHLSHGDRIRLLRDCGFDVEELIELRPAPGSTSEYDFATVEWARRWPAEEVWRARRR
jgi:SAM-dependent methyltransferase